MTCCCHHVTRGVCRQCPVHGYPNLDDDDENDPVKKNDAPEEDLA